MCTCVLISDCVCLPSPPTASMSSHTPKYIFPWYDSYRSTESFPPTSHRRKHRLKKKNTLFCCQRFRRLKTHGYMCTKTKARAHTHTHRRKGRRAGPPIWSILEQTATAPWRRGEGGGSEEAQRSSAHEFTEGFGANTSRLIKRTCCLSLQPERRCFIGSYLTDWLLQPWASVWVCVFRQY